MEDIPKAPLIELSDAEGERDRNSVIGAPPYVIACSDDSSNEEVDNMASNKGKSLRELMANRGKGQTSKAPTKSQIPADLGLKVNPDLKKKRPVESLEEGEVGPRQGAKQQKVTREHRDKRAPFVKSREELERAEVCMPPRIWSHRLEVGGAAIPYNASV